MSHTTAHGLLKRLLHFMPHTFHHQTALDLVVISAGTFPSGVILMGLLKEHLPRLQVLNITLVEPVPFRTAQFQQKKLPEFAGLTVQIAIFNGLMHEFFETHADKKFDVIYFEHPDLRALTLLLSQTMGVGWRSASLRHALPHLTTITKESTFVIASCLSHHELFQLKSLLQFSFNGAPHVVKFGSITDYFYGGPYRAGLALSFSKAFSPKLQQKRAKMIKKNDADFRRALWISCLLIFIKSSLPHATIELIIASLLLVSQCIFHSMGPSNKVVKLFLLIGSIII